MNYWAAWGPTAVAIVVAIFTYGRLMQRQDDHGEKLEEHSGRLNSLDGHVQRIDLALVRLEEYNRGFADATRLGAKQ